MTTDPRSDPGSHPSRKPGRDSGAGPRTHLTAVRRVRIVGVSGSGKTRLAGRVAAILRVPHLELDAVFWDAGWAYRDLDEALRTVRTFADESDASRGGWVADGNWSSRMQGLLDPGTPGGADVLVWLDHPRPLVTWQIVRRTVSRGLRRTELWHGNRESPRSWLRLDPQENVMRWAWVQHPLLRARMVAVLEADPDAPVIRLAGRRAVARWLRALAAAQPS